jgi:predicted nucleotide-binding protein
MKHHGSLDDLQTQVRGCGFTVASVEQIQNGHRIRTGEGAVVNWYPTTGTVSVQGKPGAKKRLEEAWAQYTGNGGAAAAAVAESPAPPYQAASPSGPPANKKVFVVHGHDDTAREQLELVLHKLGLNPFVLANTAGGGLTIIEALEKEIGPKEGQARFGIVLLTPDDMGYAKKDGPDKAEPRARQNVVLEMGMLISAIGRPNVAILKKGHLEVPSDAQGILYIPFNDHVKETVPKLVDRLRAAGFVLSPQAITNASA